MSSIAIRLLDQFDIFLGYIASAFIHILIYVVSFSLFIFSLAYFIFIPLDGGLSLNELDYLEMQNFLIFILVTVRFFKRSRSVGWGFWLGLKRYINISALVAAFMLMIGALFLLYMYKDMWIFSRSSLHQSYNEFGKLVYYIYSLIYVVALYAFTPLPKMAWFQALKKDFNFK